MEPVQEELLNFRKELHQFPEISGNERETAGRIKSFLNRHRPDELIDCLGGHGIAAIYNGHEAGKTVLLRCELDALPIIEINDFDHTSRNLGVGHKCGHDGHMVIICGVALALSKVRPAFGKVILLFQPAEENGKGAQAILKEDRFLQLKPEFVFALHNIPGLPMHNIILKRGSFTAAVNSIVIRLIGKTSHAGEPDKGINPALAMAEIIQKVDKLNNPDRNSDKFRQISYVHATMGERAYGTSAGSAELGFTFRCWTTEERDALGKEMEEIARTAGTHFGLRVDIEYVESFHANQNADEAVELIENAATKEGMPIIWQDFPNRWGEDFGLFTEEYTGALFGVGAGEGTPALHNPDYDFPDELINTGINMFHRIIQEATR